MILDGGAREVTELMASERREIEGRRAAETVKKLDGGGSAPGEVVQLGDGLSLRSEGVCQCGHWATAHRNRGAGTCEGFRCGCYTFRQVTNPDAATKGPRCQVCNRPVTGRQVVSTSNTTYQVAWRHAGGMFPESFCLTEGAIAQQTAEQEKQEKDDGPVFFIPDLTAAMAPRIAELFPKLLTEAEVAAAARPRLERTLEEQWITTCCVHEVCDHDPDTLRCSKCRCLQLVRAPQGKKRTLEEQYQLELEQARAERNRPQRAPLAMGEEV